MFFTGITAVNLNYIPTLRFLNATPTAELEPITKEYVQADEVEDLAGSLSDGMSRGLIEFIFFRRWTWE